MGTTVLKNVSFLEQCGGDKTGQGVGSVVVGGPEIYHTWSSVV